MNGLLKFISSLDHYLLKIGFYICLGLLVTLSLPALSAQKHDVQPSALARQGKILYEAGKLDEAAEIWQEAAAAYEAMGNSQGSTESLINIATAQQGLGLYDRSCHTLLEAFEVSPDDCEQLKEQVLPIEQRLAITVSEADNSSVELASILQPILEQPNSLNKTRGLLRLGDYFSHSEYLQIGQELLAVGLDTAQQINSSQEATSALLSLGNTARAIASKQQSQFPPQTVALNIIANQNSSPTAALDYPWPLLLLRQNQDY